MEILDGDPVDPDAPADAVTPRDADGRKLPRARGPLKYTKAVEGGAEGAAVDVHCVRDIVQFVPMLRFSDEGSPPLAAEVLREVPAQFMSYVELHHMQVPARLKPGDFVIIPSLSPEEDASASYLDDEIMAAVAAVRLADA